jgi:Ca2+-binding RTX toxin-like protein
MLRLLGLSPVLAALMALIPANPTSGSPEVRCQGRVATMLGTEGDDDLAIHRGSQTLVFALLGGDDYLSVAYHPVVGCGGEGADEIVLGFSPGVLFGGEGDDDLLGAYEPASLYGQDGDDNLSLAFVSSGLLSGGLGDDYISATFSHHVKINGGGGHDICIANPSADVKIANCEEVQLFP